MHINALPLLTDNYAWLLTAPGTSDAAVVDPGDGQPVLAALQQQGLTLSTVLLTHHHADHCAGVPALLQAFSQARVIASEHDWAHNNIEATPCSVGVADGQTMTLLNQPVKVMATPGHTLGAVSYYLPSACAVFTGDTLFLAGCGRLVEGTPAMLWQSLQKLRALPQDTQVYCGHEYTEKNLQFATQALAENAAQQRLVEVRELRAQNRATVPALLSTECQSNPFLRADVPQVMAALGATDPVAAFTELRKRRNSFE